MRIIAYRHAVVYLLLLCAWQEDPVAAATRSPRSEAEAIRPTGILIHHSARPARSRSGREQIAWLARLHDDRRHVTWFRGRRYTTGYHYLILRDGSLVATRPEGCPGRHARYRSDTLGLCFIGEFSRRGGGPTPAQLDAGARLCRRLMARYGIAGSQIRRHRDVNATECPGTNFPWRDFLIAITR
jgi:N-acetyl-anhydromuramyl-L-alanine amidase AmpD